MNDITVGSPIRPRRRRLLAAVGLVVLIGAMAAAIAISGAPERAFAAEHACAEGPLAAGVTPQEHSGVYRFPYGAVRTCRSLRNDSHFFGDVDASGYLLLDTDRGTVVVRVDYRDIKAGRQYTATAVEVKPDDVPDGLSSAELRQLRDDVRRRGGVQTEPWQLYYGDG